MTVVEKNGGFSPSRRALLRMIGVTAGSAAMYHAMTSLGFAQSSTYKGQLELSGVPKGATVLILGAGLAGMTAAYELRKAGYKVQVLEYNERPGGRCWTRRGGDSYTELGGEKQRCEFDKGLYINPGPWRIPFHHQNVLHYCREFGVALEPFVQVNSNAYMHSATAFDGKPQRYGRFRADYQGMVAELLAKSVKQNALDTEVTAEDREKLLASLQSWGYLDDKYRYQRGDASSATRGFDKDPGGGLGGKSVPSTPLTPQQLLRSDLWQALFVNDLYEFQTTLFQPVGGMGHIADAFARELPGVIQYNAKVTKIAQDEKGVTAHFVDANSGGETREARADFCLCTIPLSVLSQIPMNVGSAMSSAISAVPYASSVKIGLQFKRRFWEEDEQIYGGVTTTDLPIFQISYPSSNFQSRGPGVLLGGYNWGPDALQFTALSPKQRIEEAVRQGAKIHAQYPQEFQNGISVAWHRMPSTMGCYGDWTDAAREKHYDNLCRIDGRIALGGEHASYLPAWQEGAIASALDAVGRLHQRAVAGGHA
ncbi:MAG: NAD(P)/FAD-dependent oxidoreductase [Dokdonella sp.]